ncbi:MAG: hypothetical protein EXR51_01315 [Dehalococcoidia bacterium]|nr:hypothetical protein [Dehalococcoidia bacterium]
MISDDVLARALDELDQGLSLGEVLERHPGDRQELGGLLRVEQQLQALPRDISLPLTAKARLRAQILVDGRHPAAAPAPYYFSEWWNRLSDEVKGFLGVGRWGAALSRPVAAALSVLLGLGVLGGGTVSAAMEAVPGDNLYQVKTAVEQTRLALAANPQEKAETHLWIASSRFHELSKLAEHGELELIKQVASDYKRNIEQAQKHVSNKARSEAGFQKDIDLLQTNMRGVYERTPKSAQSAMALSVTPPDEPKTLNLTAGDPLQPTTAPQSSAVIAGTETITGQNGPSIALPREKGGPVFGIDDSGKAGPLTPPPFFTAPDEQQPSKGTVPAEMAPIPNKEGSTAAPAASADPERKELPVQGGGSTQIAVPDGTRKPVDGPTDSGIGPGSKSGTIQGLDPTGHRLP